MECIYLHSTNETFLYQAVNLHFRPCKGVVLIFNFDERKHSFEMIQKKIKLNRHWKK